MDQINQERLIRVLVILAMLVIVAIGAANMDQVRLGG